MEKLQLEPFFIAQAEMVEQVLRQLVLAPALTVILPYKLNANSVAQFESYSKNGPQGPCCKAAV